MYFYYLVFRVYTVSGDTELYSYGYVVLTVGAKAPINILCKSPVDYHDRVDNSWQTLHERITGHPDEKFTFYYVQCTMRIDLYGYGTTTLLLHSL